MSAVDALRFARLPNAEEVVADLLIQTGHRQVRYVEEGVNDFIPLGLSGYNVRLNANTGLLVFQYSNPFERETFHDTFKLVSKHISEIVGIVKRY